MHAHGKQVKIQVFRFFVSAASLSVASRMLHLWCESLEDFTAILRYDAVNKPRLCRFYICRPFQMKNLGLSKRRKPITHQRGRHIAERVAIIRSFTQRQTCCQNLQAVQRGKTELNRMDEERSGRDVMRHYPWIWRTYRQREQLQPSQGTPNLKSRTKNPHDCYKVYLVQSTPQFSTNSSSFTTRSIALSRQPDIKVKYI